MKIYALKDKVAGKFISTTLCETDAMFVRNSAFAILMDYPIQDIEIYCVGLFEEELGLIKPCTPRLVSWDSYKFPETRESKEKFLTIEQIDEAAKKKKQQFLQEQKDNLETLTKRKDQLINILKLEEEQKKPNKQRIKQLRRFINQLDDEINKLKEVA